MKSIFEVRIHQKNHSWNKFTFRFETLGEAQQFIKSAMTHFYKEEDDEDMVIGLYKEKKNERDNHI